MGRTQVCCDETLCLSVSFRGVSKALGAFETSKTAHPTPKRHIPQDLNLRNASKISNPKSWIKDKHQAQYSERKGANGDVITRTDWNGTRQRLGGTHYSSNLKKSPAKGPLCWDWESQWEIYKRGALLFILWRCRYHSMRCRQYGGSCVIIWDHTDEWHHLVFRW